MNNRTKVYIVFGLILTFVSGVVFGQAVARGESSYPCPLLPAIYSSEWESEQSEGPGEV